jgi:hypothetical protein
VLGQLRRHGPGDDPLQRRPSRCSATRPPTPALGVLEVYCQMLYDLDQDQALLI